ncbi:type III secretion system effector protein [Pseudomonas syringae]|uniref:XopG/HopH/AvrPtoH family type III secretion system effector n=1 Tax=Pseudomonas syringae TaxID=317 RepID=UPI000EFB0730|nr:type III secretion system effector protein [Pseudomonas syringae]MDC6489728.1 type III secretion system effector protein [Pseudomonas syringae]MDC6499460.1 type III secretion system effector protein [Pseudomonas syringae]MDC6510248.1 type III secretion system effector protein [Pseudomonas syringae]MDC6531125.1 type III secretion system effector protein [Pseudomonas syringae]MDC6552745.1 type III secretion system effector protein [Pseudomonas syringae]
MITPSRYPGIYIAPLSNEPTAAHTFKEQAEEALDHISAGPSGDKLLRKISTLASQKDRKVTLKEIEINNQCYTEAVLSRRQLEKYEPENFNENRHIASQLSRKGTFTKGEGSNAIIGWSPDKASIRLNQNGSPLHLGMDNDDKITTLAHELVHARHVLSGSSLADGGDRYNPRTGSGKEELRAVGLDKYRYSLTKKPSENSIRAEHGLPLRMKYRPHQ